MSVLYGELAELYDIAFDWDVSEEVEWLLGRLGPGCRTVIEPGCGSGRMLEAFARRGVIPLGIDLSPRMTELARRRLSAAGLRAEVVQADMTAFDLGRSFDGAACPINTLAHLTRDQLRRHLVAMAGALVPGARYLVQLGLSEGDAWEPNIWEAERGDTRLRCAWQLESRDQERGIELQRSTIEVLSGPRVGEVHSEVHEMTIWSPSSWAQALERSPFTWEAVYDGSAPARPAVGHDATGGLLWHELRRP